jgi:hypothetical protein
MENLRSLEAAFDNFPMPPPATIRAQHSGISP